MKPISTILGILMVLAFAPGALASFETSVNLGNLAGKGSNVNGENGGDEAGFAIALLPDATGDGRADLLIGAPYAEGTGVVYLVFGKDGFSSAGDLDLASLGAGGVKIQGEAQDDFLGWAVASLGDVDGDNLSDFLISAPGHDPDVSGIRQEAGRCYLIYGRDDFGQTLDLSALGPLDGLVINGAQDLDMIGLDLSLAGDFGGTPDPDFIIGAPLKDANGGLAAGVAYVVYWDDLLAAAGTLDLNALGTQGAVLEGSGFVENAAYSVSGNFDLNGDGDSDVIVGCPGAYTGGYPDYPGRAYVVYGRSGFTSPFTLADITAGGGYGIALDGASSYAQAGFSVLAIDDFNLDGFGDAAVAAPLTSPNGVNSGTVYIVYGSDDLPAQMDLGTLGLGGITLSGESAGDGERGLDLASLGDVNGDGITDIAVGAMNASPSDLLSFAGITYLVIGCRFHTANGVLGSMTKKQYIFKGGAVGDFSGCSLAGGGDVDQDGQMDILIGAYGHSTGTAYKAGRVHFLNGMDLGGTQWPYEPPTTGVGTQGNNMDFIPYIDGWGDFVAGSKVGIDIGIQVDTKWSIQSPSWPLYYGVLMLGAGGVYPTGLPFRNTVIWPLFNVYTRLVTFPVYAISGNVILKGKIPAQFSGQIIYVQGFWENPSQPYNMAASNCLSIIVH